MNKPTKRTKTKELEKPLENKSPVVYFNVDKHIAKKMYEEDLDKIKDAFGVSISEEKGRYEITSKLDVSWCRKACIVLEKIANSLDKNIEPTTEEVDEFISDLLPKPYKDSRYKGFFRTYKNEELSPRTENQEKILDTIKTKTISVIHGNAGCGKTKIVLACGINFLNTNRYDKIIIIRSMNTVGKDVGFLPGNMQEKSALYFGPVQAALIDLIGEKEFEQKTRDKKILFETVSFIRGGNFDDAVVIVDEVQNFTKHEILSILTRLCINVKIIINGDNSQVDIKFSSKDEKNALSQIIERLSDFDDVGFVKMTAADNQRHKLVADIIQAFE